MKRAQSLGVGCLGQPIAMGTESEAPAGTGRLLACWHRLGEVQPRPHWGGVAGLGGLHLTRFSWGGVSRVMCEGVMCEWCDV